MAPLNQASLEAIHRLRNYVPPPTEYEGVPVTRRAAVLLLLYADSKGDLRVVITIRAKTLSSCTYDSFQVPVCGRCGFTWRSNGEVEKLTPKSHAGRADALSETPFQTARREAWEEIGLPGIDQPLPHPFTVEHLCEFPANLAKTEIVVRPCVALLHSYDAQTGQNADPEISLIPKLDPREVAAVFTAPFYSFLRLRDGESPLPSQRLDYSTSQLNEHENSHTPITTDNFGGSARADQGSLGADAKDEDNPGEWYRGSWSLWHNSNWRMHQFFVRANTRVVKPKPHSNKEENGELAADPGGQVQRYRVFGMTARMIVDAARVAYDQEPEFQHNSHFGDEAMIAKLRRLGRLSEERRPSDQLTRETLERASKLI
ncbi:hypothetical protein N7466_005513 [Penicillium verhagenii]|uniref:uncharacterized protein n=1 Tax=Penicillium verhagenii TaxID=1562060 RepID=UPI00254542C6|nr:uncharacterized protein N7466_005513 [Penicillium verhagenii]KAJ5930020.1 hypothetical protein N7466_005513 [Penicillium verhagenii]